MFAVTLPKATSVRTQLFIWLAAMQIPRGPDRLPRHVEWPGKAFGEPWTGLPAHFGHDFSMLFGWKTLYCIVALKPPVHTPAVPRPPI
jgi:hypothetical protein